MKCETVIVSGYYCEYARGYTKDFYGEEYMGSNNILGWKQQQQQQLLQVHGEGLGTAAAVSGTVQHARAWGYGSGGTNVRRLGSNAHETTTTDESGWVRTRSIHP